MKPNDLFGRVGKKQQIAYDNFRKQLQNSKINDIEQLQGFHTRVNQTLYIAIGLVLLISTVFALFLPTTTNIIIVCSALFIFWLLLNHFQTRTYIRRFREELSNG